MHVNQVELKKAEDPKDVLGTMKLTIHHTSDLPKEIAGVRALLRQTGGLQIQR